MLDYEKTHDLRSVLTQQRSANQALFDPPKRYPPFKFYRDYYNQFQSLGWLGLPSGLFPLSWPDPPQSP